MQDQCLQLLRNYGRIKVILDKEKKPSYDENDRDVVYQHYREIGDFKLQKQYISDLDKQILKTSDLITKLDEVAEHRIHKTQPIDDL